MRATRCVHRGAGLPRENLAVDKELVVRTAFEKSQELIDKATVKRETLPTFNRKEQE